VRWGRAADARRGIAPQQRDRRSRHLVAVRVEDDERRPPVAGAAGRPRNLDRGDEEAVEADRPGDRVAVGVGEANRASIGMVAPAPDEMGGRLVVAARGSERPRDQRLGCPLGLDAGAAVPGRATRGSEQEAVAALVVLRRVETYVTLVDGDQDGTAGVGLVPELRRALLFPDWSSGGPHTQDGATAFCVTSSLADGDSSDAHRIIVGS